MEKKSVRIKTETKILIAGIFVIIIAFSLLSFMENQENIHLNNIDQLRDEREDYRDNRPFTDEESEYYGTFFYRIENLTDSRVYDILGQDIAYGIIFSGIGLCCFALALFIGDRDPSGIILYGSIIILISSFIFMFAGYQRITETDIENTMLIGYFLFVIGCTVVAVGYLNSSKPPTIRQKDAVGDDWLDNKIDD